MASVRFPEPASASPMSGRACVVTGATDGIGLVTARELARLGGTVAVVGRDPTKTENAARAIRAITGNPRVHPHVAELSLLSECHRLAQELLGAYPKLHVLVNNAGALYMRRAITPEGRERTWALNVLAPFALTCLLAQRLGSSAPARVVNVASNAHYGARLRLDDPGLLIRYSGYGAYQRSKLALVLLTYEFARRFSAERVAVNALHPGFVATRFGQNNPPPFRGAIRLLEFLFGIRPDRGARTSIYLASSPDVEGATGQYYVRERAVRSSTASYDANLGGRLWTDCASETGLEL